MYTRNMLVAVGLCILLVVNFVLLAESGNDNWQYNGGTRASLSLLSPIQRVATYSLRVSRNIWQTYFYHVGLVRENIRLNKNIEAVLSEKNQSVETGLANQRLRGLLDFRKNNPYQMLPAEIVGRDPSPWFEMVVINKGEDDGVTRGSPVMVPGGIVGQVVAVSAHFAKVILIIDKNSAVDAMIQGNRARGLIKGTGEGLCRFEFALRKDDIAVGNRVIASGFDGVFPKGHIIGSVSAVVKPNAGIFQEVLVTPDVNFDKLEEVMVVLTPVNGGKTVRGL